MRKDYKCVGCGGTMLFDPERQLIACEYCEGTEAIGLPIEEKKIRVPYSEDLKYEGYKDAKRLYECNSCKTRMASCVDAPVTRCPSCGSNDIFESQADGSHPMMHTVQRHMFSMQVTTTSLLQPMLTMRLTTFLLTRQRTV